MITTRLSERAGDLGPDPKLTITVQGTHDVGLVVHLLASGLVEHIIVAAEAVRKLRKTPGGVAALKVLAEHGGPDYTTEYPGGHDPDAGE
jgi:hypothetical protein